MPYKRLKKKDNVKCILEFWDGVEVKHLPDTPVNREYIAKHGIRKNTLSQPSVRIR
jgi:hypothetical protein